MGTAWRRSQDGKLLLLMGQRKDYSNPSQCRDTGQRTKKRDWKPAFQGHACYASRSVLGNNFQWGAGLLERKPQLSTEDGSMHAGGIPHLVSQVKPSFSCVEVSEGKQMAERPFPRQGTIQDASVWQVDMVMERKKREGSCF